MSSPDAPTRTALATHVAAEGSIAFSQMERMAASIAKSGLFGVKTSDQALALMLISQAEGRSPALAALDYHIIQGRPSLKADTILSRFQSAGGTVKWVTYTDAKVSGTFSHAQGGSVTVDWTIERAKSVKSWNDKKSAWESLTDKLNWQNYPRAMLRARVISEGVRTCYPGVVVGIYTPEEIQDGAAEIDVTPVSMDHAVQATVDARTALSADERNEHMRAMNGAPNSEALAMAFSAAWKHAGEAKDALARQAFKDAYDIRKGELATVKNEGTPS